MFLWAGAWFYKKFIDVPSFIGFWTTDVEYTLWGIYTWGWTEVWYPFAGPGSLSKSSREAPVFDCGGGGGGTSFFSDSISIKFATGFSGSGGLSTTTGSGCWLTTSIRLEGVLAASFSSLAKDTVGSWKNYVFSSAGFFAKRS